MGSILRVARNGCNYEETVFVGVGMVSAAYETGLCLSCRRVVGVRVTATREEAERWARTGDKPRHAKAVVPPEGHWGQVELERRCPECAGAVEPWGADGAGEREGVGSCPRCHGSARVENFGMWD